MFLLGLIVGGTVGLLVGCLLAATARPRAPRISAVELRHVDRDGTTQHSVVVPITHVRHRRRLVSNAPTGGLGRVVP